MQDQRVIFMPSAILEDRGLVRVAGEDARSFLQGLVTCDMDKVASGHAAYGALLSPQGKILFDFLVVEASDGFWLDTPRALVTDLVKRLGMYKLRAKVSIATEDLSVTVYWGDTAAPAGSCPDPRSAELGARAVVLPGSTEPDNASLYEAHRIALGIPKGGVDFAYGDTFPHDANLDLIGGVDFKKGCYVGQEVVSRVQHRGTARKRVVRLRFEGDAPEAGTPVMAGEIEVGVFGSSAAGHALAMLRLDKVEGEALRAGTAKVELVA
jgi:tRNA-modifying protein YgfZ